MGPHTRGMGGKVRKTFSQETDVDIDVDVDVDVDVNVDGVEKTCVAKAHGEKSFCF